MTRLKLLVTLFFAGAAALFFAVWLEAQRSAAGAGQRSSAYRTLERRLLRRKLALVETPAPVPDVVVVSMDWKAARIYGPLPWPRDAFGDLVRKLRHLGVHTIVMNPLFDAPQLKLLSPGAYRSLYPALPLEDLLILNPDGYVAELERKLTRVEGELRAGAANDPALASRLQAFVAQKQALLQLSRRIAAGDASRAFERAVLARQDIVFPTDYFSKARFRHSGAEAAGLFARQALDSVAGQQTIRRFEHVLTLYPRLLRGGAMVGINEVESRQRPFVSDATILIRHRGKVFASAVARAVARKTRGELSVGPLTDGQGLRLWLGDRQAELRPDGTFPIAYYNDASFPKVISGIDVIREKVPRSALAGKIAIVDIRVDEIASSARVPTPYGPRWISDVKATIASNLLAGHRGPTITRPGWLSWIEGVVIWLLAGFFALLTFRVSLLRSLAAAAALVGIVAVLDVYLFLPARLWLSSGILVFEIPLLLIASIGGQYLIQRAERQKVRRAFGFYLSEQVLEHVMHEEGALRLGGERRALSILFSDIRGFTSVSERADPEALGEALNVHLTQLTEAVFAESGTLDKYMGDCVMAFFGAPVPFEDHAAKAVRAALAMQQRLREIQPVWLAKCGQEVAIGVGVATGDVIVGNMGSERLFDYTVIGDTANLASRLEGLTKVYGVEVLISGETVRAIAGRFSTLEVDLVRVKGKDRPVSIHEVVCEGEPDAGRRRYNECCSAGIAAFRARRWNEARGHFAQAYTLQPEARLPPLYQERIERYEHEEPAADWDGATAFDHK